MAAYGYARVSSTAQNPAAQVEALIAAGVPEGNIAVEHASGTRSDRPALAELLAIVGEGDTLAVWRLDRLGRSTSHLIETVNGLTERGVQFRSLSESIDTTTANGKMQLGIFSILAAFERDLIAERTTAGLAAARASGKELGRRTHAKPMQVPYIHRLIAEGKSYRDIAVLTGLSRAVVGRVARNEIPSLAAYQPHAPKENADA